MSCKTGATFVESWVFMSGHRRPCRMDHGERVVLQAKRMVVHVMACLACLPAGCGRASLAGDPAQKAPPTARWASFSGGDGEPCESDASGFGPPTGWLVTSVDECGLAAELGFHPGDVLVSVGRNRNPDFNVIETVLNKLPSEKDTVDVLVRRNSQYANATHGSLKPAPPYRWDVQGQLRSTAYSSRSIRISLSREIVLDAIHRSEHRKSVQLAQAQALARQPLTLSDGTTITRAQLAEHNKALMGKNAASVIEQLSERGGELAQDMEQAALVMGALEDAFQEGNDSAVCEIMHETTKNGLAARVGKVLRSTGADSRYYEMPGNRVLTGAELWEKAADTFVKSHVR